MRPSELHWQLFGATYQVKEAQEELDRTKDLIEALSRLRQELS